MSTNKCLNMIDNLLKQISSVQSSENKEAYSDVKQFLRETDPPSNISEIKNNINEFIKLHSSSNLPFILITSGGTTVPLELNTVRFIDNFSTGTRGSASCEYFLKYDCNVIFLHRRGSICPFIRHIQYSTSKYFDLNFFKYLNLNPNNNTISLDIDDNNNVLNAFKCYRQYVCNDKKLLLLEYESVYEYFYLTIEICKLLKPYSSRTILYMASAVSDFYIPFKQLNKDKIQSSSGPFSLNLSNTPKMLGYFKYLCGNNCLLVSFKLETKNDKQFLFMKARKAIKNYGSDVVCSNILNTRRYEVWMVTEYNDTYLNINNSKYKELEEDIVVYLMNLMKSRQHI